MATSWLISACASAIGIGVGGGLAWIMKGFNRGYGFIYSLCAGLIMGLLLLEMIPESIELGGWVTLFFGLSIGLILFQYIHQLMDKNIIITDNQQKDIFVRSGVLLSFSIAIHNFPVGIVLGSTQDTELGGLMLATLVLHNIPEGIIVFTPLFLAGFGIFTWIIVTALITFPIAIGTLVGQFLDKGMTSLLAFMINLALAIIFMVAIKEIFREAIRNSSILYSLVVGLCGNGFVYLYMNLFP